MRHERRGVDSKVELVVVVVIGDCKEREQQAQGQFDAHRVVVVVLLVSSPSAAASEL